MIEENFIAKKKLRFQAFRTFTITKLDPPSWAKQLYHYLKLYFSIHIVPVMAPTCSSAASI